MKSETRSFPRKVMRCPVRIQLQGGNLRGKTIDIALAGISLMVPEQLQPGMTCTVSFEAMLNGTARQVTGTAKVVYSILSGTDGFRTGLQFVQIDAANNKTLAELMI
jgi:c-di-GMP-binding flagellar brake protein YcgR